MNPRPTLRARSQPREVAPLETAVIIGAVVAAGLIWFGGQQASLPSSSPSAVAAIAAPSIQSAASSIPSAPRVVPATRPDDRAAETDRRPAYSPAEASARAEATAGDNQAQQVQARWRAWGKVDAVGAVASATQQDGPDARAVEFALLAAAEERPALAVDLSRMLLTLDPEKYSAQATALVSSLTRAGNFEEAARLATGVPYASAAALTTQAFAAWGREAPAAALRAIDQLPSARLRGVALKAAIAGWAETNPQALARHARAEFDGDARAWALIAAGKASTSSSP